MTEPRELPILFKPDLVRAIIAGRKTQTRRIIDPQLPSRTAMADLHSGGCGLRFDTPSGYWLVTGSLWAVRRLGFSTVGRKCPYGADGDLLYVRESHWRYGHMEPYTDDNGKDRSTFAPTPDTPIRFEPTEPSARGLQLGWHKRPSIFLPKDDSRIWLRVTDVRVERVQDITGADAQAEGCVSPPPEEPGPHCPEEGARTVFVDLWDRINKHRGYGWDSNPWVWVVTFEVVSTTGRPS